MNHFHGDDLVPAVLKATYNLSDEVTLDTIGLDHDEATFSIGRSVWHFGRGFASKKRRKV